MHAYQNIFPVFFLFFFNSRLQYRLGAVKFKAHKQLFSDVFNVIKLATDTNQHFAQLFSLQVTFWLSPGCRYGSQKTVKIEKIRSIFINSWYRLGAVIFELHKKLFSGICNVINIATDNNQLFAQFFALQVTFWLTPGYRFLSRKW